MEVVREHGHASVGMAPGVEVWGMARILFDPFRVVCGWGLRYPGFHFVSPGATIV
jgi:hypothetical protein